VTVVKPIRPLSIVARLPLVVLAAGLASCGGDGPANPAPAMDTIPSPGPRIYLADFDGDGIMPLGLGSQPAWSPDGQRIAFVRDRGPFGNGIFLIDADGANTSSLVAGTEPAWSPDGTQLVFTNVEGISRANVDGSAPVLLVAHDTLSDTPDGDWGDDRVGSPSWSPDGQHIAFQFRESAPNRVSKVYIMNADGSGARRLTDSDDDHHESQPSWSPDGAAIAYTGSGLFADNESEHGSILKLDPDEGVPYLLYSATTDETIIHGEISWSPDGSTIAFTAGYESTYGIWALDPQAGSVTFRFPGHFDPAWGPDGRIAFASGHNCANEWVVSIWVGGPGQAPSNLYFHNGPALASSLDVRLGGAVEWLSRNQLAPFTSHIVSTSHPPAGTPFDSGLMEPGDTFRFTPDVEGTWAYVELVSGMTGTFTASPSTSWPGLNCSSTGDIK
jgi:Tol biopolymer transport system component